MTKKEYGELLKYLGILRYEVTKKINEDFDAKREIIEALNMLMLNQFLLEQIMDA